MDHKSTTTEKVDERFLLNYEGSRSEKFVITCNDLISLEPPTYIGGNLLEMWLAVIQKERAGFSSTNKIHIFNSDFYRKLTGPVKSSKQPVTESKVRHKLVEKWTKSIDIFEKDFIIIPINTGKHWTVAIICHPNGRKQKVEDVGERIRSPCILFFDSMGDGKSEAAEIFRNLSDYLVEEFKHKHGKLSRFRRNKFVSLYPKIIQQTNGYDCGYFVLQYVESFFSHPITEQQIQARFAEGADYDFDLIKWFPRSIVNGKRREIFDYIVKYIHNNHPENIGLIPPIFIQSDNGNDAKKEEEEEDIKETNASDIPMEVVSQDLNENKILLTFPNHDTHSSASQQNSQASSDSPRLVIDLGASNLLSQQFSQMDVSSCAGEAAETKQNKEEMEMWTSAKVALSPVASDKMDISISPIETFSSQLVNEPSQPNTGRHILDSSTSIIDDDSGDEWMSKISSQDGTFGEESKENRQKIQSSSSSEKDNHLQENTTPKKRGNSSSEKFSFDSSRVKIHYSPCDTFSEDEDFKDEFILACKSRQAASQKPPATINQPEDEDDADASPPLKKKKIAANYGVSQAKSRSRIPAASSTIPTAFAGRNIHAEPACVYIDHADHWLIANMNVKAAKVPATSHIKFTTNFMEKRVTHFVPNFHPIIGLTLSKNLFLAITGNLTIVTLSWIEKAFRRNELDFEMIHSLARVEIPNWPYAFGNTCDGELGDFEVVFVKPLGIVDFQMTKEEIKEIIKSTGATVKEYHFSKVEEQYATLRKAEILDEQKTFVVSNNIVGRQNECNKLFNKLLWITFHPNFILHSVWTGRCSIVADESKQFMLTSQDIVEAQK